MRHELLHRIELGARSAAVVFADHVVADAAGADERGDIDRWTRSDFEAVEVVGERAPILRHAEISGARGGIGNHAIVDRRDRCPLPRHFGCDALQRLAGRATVDEHVELRLAEEIDEARRHDEVRRVDAHGCAGVRERAHRGNRVAHERDVSTKPRRARAVHDVTISDHDFEAIGHFLSRRLYTREDTETRN